MLNKLKARYERRSPVALLSMAVVDVLCWCVVRLRPFAEQKCTNSAINKVLLVNPAHIGDVVISTSVIRSLKTLNPNISIGFVVGSWAKLALERHPGVDRVFVVDHWKLNRANISSVKKICRYLKTWQQTRKALVAEGFDAGILLNSFSPNLASLLWCSRVAVRVGYISAGMTTLLNRVLPKPSSNQAEGVIQQKLLECLGFHELSSGWLTIPNEFKDDLGAFGRKSQFVVLHPGTGNPAKAWTLERWCEVGQYFHDQGFEVIVTGQGPKEQLIAGQICAQIHARSLVGALSWGEWLSLLAKARMVIGVDSAVGHVCAAIGQPFIGVYSGIGMAKRWTPVGAHISILTKVVPCSPCHTRPCAERVCITGVTAQDVIDVAALELRRTNVS